MTMVGRMALVAAWLVALLASFVLGLEALVPRIPQVWGVVYGSVGLVPLLLSLAVLHYPWDRLRGRVFGAWLWAARLAAVAAGLASIGFFKILWFQLFEGWKLPIEIRAATTIFLMIPAAWMWLHIYLVLSLAPRSRVAYPLLFGRDDRQPLLSFQEPLVERLVRIARTVSRSGPGELVAVRGEWGSGKSHALRAMARSLEADGGTQVVWVDVWRYESEPDLHYAIVEQVASHPKNLFPWGWWWYPASLALQHLVYTLERFQARIRLSIRAGELDLNFGMPLRWQKALESLVRYKVVVFVLDEIDRATPAVAQAALTIARRALHLPGCKVFISYVPEQLRYKAFNPLSPAFSPDLVSTFLTVLHEDKLRTPTGYSALDIEELKRALAPEQKASKPETSDQKGLIAWQGVLGGHLFTVTEDRREWLHQLGEEKYVSLRVNAVVEWDKLGLTVVEVMELFPEVRSVVVEWPRVTQAGPSLHFSSWPSGQLAVEIQRTVGAMEQRTWIARHQSVNLRRLAGSLLELLQQPPVAGPGVKEQLIARITLAVYRSLR